MVSNSLKMDLQELLDELQRMRRESGDDPEYQEVRGSLPPDWPS